MKILDYSTNNITEEKSDATLNQEAGKAIEIEENNNIEAEENREDDENIEDHTLDVKAKSNMIEDFEITVFKEEVGCIHEIVMPKGHKRGGISSLASLSSDLFSKTYWKTCKRV